MLRLGRLALHRNRRRQRLILPEAHFDPATIRRDVPARSAGFQTCCIADFQVGRMLENARPAGLETRDTADLEVCATVAVQDASRPPFCASRLSKAIRYISI
jgi:hypothetical protein